MRYFLVFSFVLTLFSSSLANAQQIKLKSVASCNFGEGKLATLLKEKRSAETEVFYLKTDGEAILLYEGDARDSEGLQVKAQCLGRKEKVLLISGQFSSNYMHGIAVRYNHATSRWDRLNFAERETTKYIIFKDNAITFAIPNPMNESGKKYIIYNMAAGVEQSDDAIEIETLPARNGQVLIHVKDSK